MFIDTHLVTATLLITVKLTAIFLLELWEHVGVSNLTGKRLKNIQGSAVSDNLLQCHYTIDFDHFDILSTDASKCNLLVKESLLIKGGISVLNGATKSFPLELFD